MVWIIAFFTLSGFNFTFWLMIGIVRFFYEKIQAHKNKKKRFLPSPFTFNDVAAIIPAHNEEASIEKTIEPLLQVLPQKNIYVVSDYSTDKTVEIIRKMGIRSLDLSQNKGKAKALVHIMREYGLLDAYKAILINDADSIIDPQYIAKAIQAFRDPEIAAVHPHGITKKKKYKFKEMFYIAYRMRLWLIVQLGMRFGQTWKLTNVSYIAPGSYSIYRTNVLKKLEIDAPGLLIEDFNMTFELHKKKLGKIAYLPSVYGIHQDPNNLHDYIRQVRRWNIGFFQTVKRNGIWLSFFWVATSSFLIELSLYALFFLSLPLLIIIFALNNFEPVTVPLLYRNLSVADVFIGVFVMDYVTTVIAAIAERKPIILFYGLGFFVLRYIDAVIFLSSIPIAFLSKSDGVWKSPKRL